MMTLENATLDQVSAADLDGSNLSFNITDRKTTKIYAVKVHNAHNFTVSYNTANKTTTSGEPFKNYTISIFDGLSSPVGRKPIQSFHGIDADYNGDVRLESDSKINLLSGQYVLAFSVGSDVGKTLCCYVKLINGKMGATAHEDLSLESLSTNNLGFEFAITSEVLPGIDPVKNGDTVYIYNQDVEPNKRVGFGRPHLTEQGTYLTKITVEEVVSGGQYNISYFCGDKLGACSAMEQIIIGNIL